MEKFMEATGATRCKEYYVESGKTYTLDKVILSRKEITLDIICLLCHSGE